MCVKEQLRSEYECIKWYVYVRVGTYIFAEQLEEQLCNIYVPVEPYIYVRVGIWSVVQSQSPMSISLDSF